MCQKMTQFYILTPIFLNLLIQGCSSPLKAPQTNIDHGEQIPEMSEAVESLTEIDYHIQLPITQQSDVELTLAHRMEEIERLTPANSLDWGSNVGTNLYHEPASPSPLALDDAILFTIENNLDIQIASLDPLISQQSKIAAEAAFDFLFGAGVSSQRSKVPQQQALIGGVPLNSAVSTTNTFSSNLSLVRQLYGGGSVTLTTDVTKTDNQTAGSTSLPNPAWQTVGTINVSQPLLRNLGEPVTLAQIRLTEITHNQSKEELRNTLNSAVTSAEHAYLNLSLQWKTLQVKTWLLQLGEEVVEILDIRRSYDAGEADFAQAVATVQQRRADVISQQSLLQNASDTLKKIINTEEYALQSESIVQPTGSIKANPISISLRQAMMTALENRPDLRKLNLSIRSESIQVEVADNARLPQLDMQAQMAFRGLGENIGDGYQEVFDTDFINYLAGLTFEIPLGNRAADANYTSARLQKMSAVATYKQGVQQAIIDVKSALRDIVTNAALIQANRSYRIAQTENLRALGVEEETMAGLSPTFLNLKLQTQSGLATARIAEFSSIINYNKAIASLYLAMGTTLKMHQVDIKTDSPPFE